MSKLQSKFDGGQTRFFSIIRGVMPMVSVLMAVYKTKHSILKEAIESVLAQTFTDFELLILDDCPADDRAGFVRSYRDPRIKYRLNTANMGVSAARNRLMDIAEGAYWAVMDHDDVWLPTKLERQVAFMDSHPEVVACGTAYRRMGGCPWKRSLVRHEERHEEIFARLFSGARCITPACCCAPTSFANVASATIRPTSP